MYSTARIENSAQNLPIPLLYGQQRFAGDLIEQFFFKPFPQTEKVGGKGGLFGGQTITTGYIYNACQIIGLCEGPIDDMLLRFASDGSVAAVISNSPTTDLVFKGTPAQPQWSTAQEQSAGARNYSFLSYWASSQVFSDSPQLPTFTFEARGAISAAVTEIVTVSGPNYTVPLANFNLSQSVTENFVVPNSPYTIQASNYQALQSASVVSGKISIEGYGPSSGVVYTLSGLPLTSVSITPTVTGTYQYLGTGVYVFAPGDAGTNVTVIDLAILQVKYAIVTNGTLSTASTTISSISSTSGISVGDKVVGNGIPPGTFVSSVPSSSTVVVTNTPTANGGNSLQFWGAALTQVNDSGFPGEGQFQISVSPTGGVAAAPGSYGYGVLMFSPSDNGKTIVVIDILDADPAEVSTDFLTNPRYGSGIPTSAIGDLTQMSNWAYASGIFISLALVQPTPGQNLLKDIATALCGEWVWASGLLTFVPYGDTTISGYGKTYTPAPIITLWGVLGDGDYMKNTGTLSVSNAAFMSQDPIICNIVDPYTLYNQITVKYSDRGNSYNPAPAQAQNLASMFSIGVRAQDAKELEHILCFESAAQASAQLQLGRQEIHRTFAITMPWYFILLDPMDIIQFSDPVLGTITAQVLEIEENQNDLSVTISFQEVLQGTGTIVVAPTGAAVAGGSGAAGGGSGANGSLAPSPASPPIIFEPPLPLSISGNPEIWLLVGLSGGAQVWVSTDDETYTQIGQVLNGIVGTLTTDFPFHTDPDESDTLAVDFSASEGSVNGATSSQADAFLTLSYLGQYPTPALPLLGSVPGGTLGAHTYYARITYVFASGEGPATIEQSIAIASDNLPTVSAPTVTEDAVGWNVYLSTVSGAEKLQNASPLAFSANFTLPTSGLVSGSSPPGSSTAYELIAYSDATLTSTYNYNFDTYIRRGLFVSTIEDHPAGSNFARLNGDQFTYQYPANVVGETVYIKVLATNMANQTVQTLDDVQPYAYEVQGYALSLAPPSVVGLSATTITAPGGGTTPVMDVSWLASVTPNVSSYLIEWSTNSGSTWSQAVVAESQTTYTISPALSATAYMTRVASAAVVAGMTVYSTFEYSTPLSVTSSTGTAGSSFSVSTQTGTTYTLQTTDALTFIRFTNSGTITITLPNNLPVGFQCAVEQAGTGQITLSPASGASLQNAHSFTSTYGQYSVIGVTVDTNSGGTSAEYILTGDGAT